MSDSCTDPWVCHRCERVFDASTPMGDDDTESEDATCPTCVLLRWSEAGDTLAAHPPVPHDPSQ